MTEEQLPEGMNTRRRKVADRITQELQEHGAMKTSELVDKLYDEFSGEDGYSSKKSFRRTLTDIRRIMQQQGEIECEQVEGSPTIDAWEWTKK